jgi:hypothetical protein
MTDIEITPNHEEESTQEEAVEEPELAEVYPSTEPEEEPTTIHRETIDQPMSSNKNLEEDEDVEGPGDIPVEPDDTPEPVLADPFEITDEVIEDDLGLEVGTIEEEIKVAAIQYTESQLEAAHKFLNKYGIRTSHLSDEQVVEKLRKIQDAKAVASQVLSRGRVIDTVSRILEYVPDGMIGEFKRDNDLDISRAKALKWEVFVDEKAKLESATGGADGCTRLGDLILMVIPEEVYVGTRLARADRLAERRKVRKSKERKPSQGDTIMGADPLVPVIQL